MMIDLCYKTTAFRSRPIKLAMQSCFLWADVSILKTIGN